MAFPTYDGYSRSRRQSIGYAATPVSYTQQPIYPENRGHGHGHGYGDYPQPSYQIYGPPPPATVPTSHRLTGPSYEDLGMEIHEPYYQDGRQHSSGHLPMPSPHSSMSMGHSRHRRHSTVSYTPRPPAVIDTTYSRTSSTHIKFKRKGAFSAGINLGEAQDRVRLSGNDSYRMHELHADSRDRILLRVQWSGYNPMTYEIPLDGYDGRLSLQTLARRVSRACAHYLQANMIPVSWERVQLHHLEEISYGVWQPMLSAR